MTRALLLALTACGSGVYSYRAEALCDAPAGPHLPAPSAADVSEIIVGSWLHCDGPPMFNHGESGVEFTAMGFYVPLAVDADGTFAPMPGLDGRWDTSQVTAMQVQFNWHPDSDTTDYAFLVFEDNPRRFVTTLTDQTVPSRFVWVP